MHEADRWQEQHPNVLVVLADRPVGDWRDQEGWGYTWSWRRKVRVEVNDGHEGQQLVDLVLARWPDVRIQLRND